MSKAFTKELDDDEPSRNARSRQASGLPPGAQNFMTAAGAQRLRDELDRLVLEARPRAKALPDAGEAARQLADVNQRVAEVQRTLRSATVVPAPDGEAGEVRFGASVTLRSEDGSETHCRIVGVDEAEEARGSVSWLSATAKALLGARLGQRVQLDGDAAEVVGISY